MKTLLRLALGCLLASVCCPLHAQMPGAGGNVRVPPQLGGSGGTTGVTALWSSGGQPFPVNCNQTGDTPIPIVSPTPNYRIANIFIVGESGSFTTAKFGLYTGPGQTGNTLIGQTALSNITTLATNATGGMYVPGTPGANMTAAVVYFNIGTAQGGTCTLHLYLAINPLAAG